MFNSKRRMDWLLISEMRNGWWMCWVLVVEHISGRSLVPATTANLLLTITTGCCRLGHIYGHQHRNSKYIQISHHNHSGYI